MSNRTFDANKAILAAWEKEQDLVREGKGTRDWTQEQQQDILDRGKAYDEDGKAFHGQHMKSVEKYPEYQGDPNNIQFLTKSEHLEAHRGSWQNPTNWYYDPVSKQFLTFGECELIPCEVIKLSNPVITIETPPVNTEAEILEETQPEQSSGTDPPIPNPQKSTVKPQSVTSDSSTHKTVKKVAVTKTTGESVLKRFTKGAGKIARKVGGFVLEHKEEIIGIAFTVGSAIWAAVSFSDGNSSGEKSDVRSDDNLDYRSSSNDMDYAYTDNSCCTERSSPREHEVPRHSQRYHTKDGIVIREKEPYHRGGKKEE